MIYLMVILYSRTKDNYHIGKNELTFLAANNTARKANIE